MEKHVPKLKGVEFNCCSYADLVIPPKSIIYCDIPYSGTKQYAFSKGFDHEAFWQWCRDMKEQGHTIFVSEYNAPEDFQCVWEQEVKSSLSANGTAGGSKKSTEKLFTQK